ncbi:MAG: AI-2E family transporter [bacterium]|nr:AI-2E family transporter [bacterium]
MREPSNINITITSGTVVKAILLTVLAIVLYLIADIVLVVLVAVVIASAVEPATRFIMRYGIARPLAVLFIYISAALVFAGIFYSFIPTLLRETSNIVASVPEYVDYVSNSGASEELNLEERRDLVQGVTDGIIRSKEAAREIYGASSFRNTIVGIRQVLGSVSDSFIQTVSLVFGGVLSFILIVVLSFYLAVQEDGIGKFLRIITPRKNEDYIINLWRRTQLKIGYWMQGQFLLAILVGVLVYLGLTILGVRNALFLAFVAAVFEIIPLFGPILSAIPAVAIAYFDSGLTFGLLVVGLYVIIQQFENHLIYPYVVKKIVGVPPIMVILAIVVGAKLAGFLGIILSVPLAAVLMEYLDDLEKNKSNTISKQPSHSNP